MPVPVFACSFDAASPFAGFDVSTGAGTTTGRTLLGASLATGASLQKYYGITGPGATIVCGSALKYPVAFSNAPMSFSDRFTNTVTSHCVILSDGRFMLQLSSYLDAVVSTAGPSTFVLNTGEFYYVEFVTVFTAYSQVPTDATHSRVTIALDSSLYVNNLPILAAAYLEEVVLLNTSIISPQFNTMTYVPPGGGLTVIVDDVYLDGTRLGDGNVPPTDASFDINAVDPYLTQAGLEWAADPDINLILTQAALEVVFARASGRGPFPEYLKRRMVGN